MVARYYYGEATDLGTVKATTARNFAELVDHYLQMPVPINRTREEFGEMTQAQRQATKRVNYLVPCAFEESPCRRETTLATVANLLFLDVDDSDEARDLLPQLERRVAPFAFALYTTASHTADNPRLRLVVSADAIPVESYAQAVTTLAARVGATPNRESRVSVQPMFLPSVFLDQDLDTDHPLIAENRTGKTFGVRDIDETLSVGSSAPAPTPTGDISDDLEFLRPPLPEITKEIAEDALNSLDPDCRYDLWLDAANALKHQFEDDGFDLWDEWSQKGSKYPGESDMRKKWRSLKPTPKGRLPVTIRTLLHHAVTHGAWQSNEAKDVCYKAVREYILSVSTFSGLATDAIRKVASTPLLSSTETDALLNLITAEAKRRWQEKISIITLRKDYQRWRERLRRAPDDEGKKRVPAWARGVGFVSAPGVFVRHATNERWTPENFDRIYGRKLLPTEDEVENPTPQRMASPIVKPSDYVLNDIKCPIAYDFDYNPTCPNEVFFVRDSKTFLNTYTRSYPAPRPGNGIVEQLLLPHMENLIGEPEYRRVVLDWMAYHVQHPGRKVRWAILLQGEEGCGKSLLAEVLRAVLGAQHVKAVDCGALRQNWNEWAVGHQLVVLEEIRVKGHERHEVMNVLKPLITNPYISINRRNTDNREWPNRTNYLLFTNHHDAIVISPGDRRYFVVESALQTEAQVKKLTEDDPDYFVKLFDLIGNHGPELRHFFEEWAIAEDFNPDAQAPKTIYRERLVESSANELQAAVREVIATSETPLIQPDLLARDALMDALTLLPGVKPPSPQYLRSVLVDEGFSEVGRARVDGVYRHIFAHSTFDGDAKSVLRDRVTEKEGDPF